MREHNFKATASNGANMTVKIGYSTTPQNHFYLYVTNEDGSLVCRSKSYPTTLDPYIKKLSTYGITMPPKLVHALYEETKENTNTASAYNINIMRP